MNWEVEYTDEFEVWWDGLDEDTQDDVAHAVEVLIVEGRNTPFPISSAVRESRHSHMRELRVQSKGRPIRVLYAFDPRRCAILLFGGDKRGDDRWYEVNVPIADRLYDEHVATLEQEERRNDEGGTMAGHKPWSEIRKKMSPERQARVDARVRETLAEMPLHELRRARQLTQQQLADALGIEQGNISKLERRTDMYVSTLRKYIEALGGTLDITAHFPDGDVRIQQFREVTP